MKKYLPLLAGSLLALSSFAEDHATGAHHRPHHPPQESLDACASKKAGDDCSFMGRKKKEVSGKCFTPDESKPLACRPEHGGHHAGKEPVEESPKND